jgi:hypothetical protein
MDNETVKERLTALNFALKIYGAAKNNRSFLSIIGDVY